MRPQPGFSPNCMTLGSGPRRALALHCTMAFGGAWSGFAKALPECTLLAPDMPSHGRSADWDEVSDFSDTVFSGALSVMDEAPMDVIGHSFGAVTALRLAAFHPEKVKTLTLIEPVFFIIAARDAPQTMAAHDAQAQPYVTAIAAGDKEGAARAFNRMWSATAPPWESLPARNRAAMVRAIHVVPDTQAFLFEDAAGLLAPGRLAALDMPTLLLRGEEAHPAIIATNDGLAQRIPHATQAAVPGAGHMAPISHPAETAQAVRKLFEQSAES